MPVTMNALVDQITSETNLTDKQVRAALKSAVNAIRTELAEEGGKVTVTGLGTFKSQRKGDRYARNPRTNQQTYVDAYLKPTFRASELCKDIINGRR